MAGQEEFMTKEMTRAAEAEEALKPACPDATVCADLALALAPLAKAIEGMGHIGRHSLTIEMTAEQAKRILAAHRKAKGRIS